VTRDAAVVANGELRHVCLDREGGSPTPVPDAVRTAFEPYLSPDGKPPHT
jgi:acyl-CoA thioesterase FadM